MNFAFALLVLAGLVGLAAWIWLIVVAFQNKEPMWGALLIASLILPIGPIVGLIFLILKWSIARRPGILLLSSTAVSIVAILLVMSQARKAFEDLANSPEFAGNFTLDPDATPPAGAPAEVLPDPAPAPTQLDSPPPPRPRGPGSDRPRPANRNRNPDRPPAPLRLPTDAQPDPDLAAPAQPGGPDAWSASRSESTGVPQEKPETSSGPAVPTRSPYLPPVDLALLEVGESNPNRMRPLRVRVANPGTQAIAEIRLDLDYRDARGARLGHWRTTHIPTSGLIVSGLATNEFELQAFFVPQFTRDVRLGIEGVVFADGTRWPAGPGRP